MSKDNFFGDGMTNGEQLAHTTTSTQERASVRKIWRNIIGCLSKLKWRKKRVKSGISTQSTSTSDAEKKDNSSSLVNKFEMDIFTIVTIDKGSFVALGNKRLTDFGSIEDCKRWVKERDYKFLFNLMATIAEAMIEEKREG